MKNDNKNQQKQIEFYEKVSRTIDMAYRKAEIFSKKDSKLINSEYKSFYPQASF